MLKAVYNHTGGPVVVDSVGHSIGGREWGVVETTTDEVKRATDAGFLLEVEKPKGDQSSLNPDAREVFERLAEYEKAAKALGNANKDDLVELAVGEGLSIDPENPPHKDDLVSALAIHGVEAPPKGKSGSKGGTKSDGEEA